MTKDEKIERAKEKLLELIATCDEYSIDQMDCAWPVYSQMARELREILETLN